ASGAAVVWNGSEEAPLAEVDARGIAFTHASPGLRSAATGRSALAAVHGPECRNWPEWRCRSGVRELPVSTRVRTTRVRMAAGTLEASPRGAPSSKPTPRGAGPT